MYCQFLIKFGQCIANIKTMNYLKRDIFEVIIENLHANKVLVILGSRRTGKTELLKNILKNINEQHLFFDGDDFTTQDLFSTQTIEHYKSLLGPIKLLVIDEAQQIKNIGRALKLIVDHIPGVRVIITGSSAFDISNKIGEPLTGRKITFQLYPFSQSEFNQAESIIETHGRLRERLVFGSYPELIHIDGKDKKEKYLKELVSSYLMKDILSFEGIRNADKILNLLKLIAFQIGKDVSLHELGRQIGLHKNTVDRYLDLLSKTFIVFGLSAFSRNLRNEISKSKRWYFYDNGIRNILASNLNGLENRNDQGELWENYIISERIKYQSNTQMLVSNYFWRTYQQQEIDWIEERGGKLFAYEMKFNPNKKARVPTSWLTGYPGSEYHLINPKNYLQWIS